VKLIRAKYGTSEGYLRLSHITFIFSNPAIFPGGCMVSANGTMGPYNVEGIEPDDLRDLIESDECE